MWCLNTASERRTVPQTIKLTESILQVFSAKIELKCSQQMALLFGVKVTDAVQRLGYRLQQSTMKVRIIVSPREER